MAERYRVSASLCPALSASTSCSTAWFVMFLMFSDFIFFVLSVYEGWFLQPGTGTNRNSNHRKDKGNVIPAGVDSNGRDRTVFPWRDRVLREAGSRTQSSSAASE